MANFRDNPLLSLIFPLSRAAILGAALVLPLSPSLVHATSPTGSAVSYPALQVCDPHYYKTLEDKAWMEVQREIQVNQTVITKPASTLALSCFDQQINQAASAGGAFSDNANSNATKNAINTAIGTSFSSYYAANFNDPPLFAGTTFNSNGTFNGACDRLNQLWASIKCAVADPSTTPMKPLDYFRVSATSGIDIRDTSGAGATCGPASSSTLASYYAENMVGTTDLKKAQSTYGVTYFDSASPDFCAYSPKTGKDALADVAVCKVKQGNTTVEKKCNQMNAVPTGVLVSYTGGDMVRDEDPWGNPRGTSYWSYSCLNPGCYFDVHANSSKIKFSAGGTAPSGLKCSAKPSAF